MRRYGARNAMSIQASVSAPKDKTSCQDPATLVAMRNSGA